MKKALNAARVLGREASRHKAGNPAADADGGNERCTRVMFGLGASHAHMLTLWLELAKVNLIYTAFSASLAACAYAVRFRTGPRVPRAIRLAALAALAVAAAVFPFVLLRSVMRHFMVYFTTSACAVTTFFKCIEALLGTHPRGAAADMRAWIAYFVNQADMRFVDVREKVKALDEQPDAIAAATDAPPALCRTPSTEQASASAQQRAYPAPSPPRRAVIPRLGAYAAAYMALNMLLVHAGTPSGYRPFARALGPRGAVLDVYYWAWCLVSCGEWVSTLSRIPIHLLGYDSLPAFDMPLLAATSPRDFWGRRWNLIIHRLMHRTYFRTVARASGSATLGALAAFVCSAAFHEFMCAARAHDAHAPRCAHAMCRPWLPACAAPAPRRPAGGRSACTRWRTAGCALVRCRSSSACSLCSARSSWRSARRCPRACARSCARCPRRSRRR